MISFPILLGNVALLLSPLALAQNTCTGKASDYAVTLTGYQPAESFCSQSYPYPKSTVTITSTITSNGVAYSTRTTTAATLTVTGPPITVVKTVTGTTTTTRSVAPTLHKRGPDPKAQSSVLSVLISRAPKTLQASICDCIRTATNAVETQTSIINIGQTKTRVVSATATTTSTVTPTITSTTTTLVTVTATAAAAPRYRSCTTTPGTLVMCPGGQDCFCDERSSVSGSVGVCNQQLSCGRNCNSDDDCDAGSACSRGGAWYNCPGGSSCVIADMCGENSAKRARGFMGVVKRAQVHQENKIRVAEEAEAEAELE